MRCIQKIVRGSFRTHLSRYSSMKMIVSFLNQTRIIHLQHQLMGRMFVEIWKRGTKNCVGNCFLTILPPKNCNFIQTRTVRPQFTRKKVFVRLFSKKTHSHFLQIISLAKDFSSWMPIFLRQPNVLENFSNDQWKSCQSRFSTFFPLCCCLV